MTPEKSYDEITDMERREEIALRLGWTILALDWPCRFDPKSGEYEAALSLYDEAGSCLGKLDQRDSLYYEALDLVSIRSNCVKPVPFWTTDDNEAIKLFQIWGGSGTGFIKALIMIRGEYKVRFSDMRRLFVGTDPATIETKWCPTIAEAVCRAFILAAPLPNLE